MSTPRVGTTVHESTPGWNPPRRPPPGASNVVMIVLDDTGFAHLGCFGSDIDTPNIDRLAAAGLRYTNFHTTALCSPSRACLLTGRMVRKPVDLAQESPDLVLLKFSELVWPAEDHSTTHTTGSAHRHYSTGLLLELVVVPGSWPGSGPGVLGWFAQ